MQQSTQHNIDAPDRMMGFDREFLSYFNGCDKKFNGCTKLELSFLLFRDSDEPHAIFEVTASAMHVFWSFYAVDCCVDRFLATNRAHHGHVGWSKLSKIFMRVSAFFVKNCVAGQTKCPKAFRFSPDHVLSMWLILMSSMCQVIVSCFLLTSLFATQES